MKIHTHDRGPLTVMALQGNLALDAAQSLREATMQLNDGKRDVVLDLAMLEFIDSRGLETLIWLQERCGELLGRLRVACCPDHIRRVLEVTRLWSHLDCHPNVDAAIASLGQA